MRQCWNCSKWAMCPAEDLGKGWYKCSDCGATWIEVPEPSSFGLTKERDEATGRTKYKAHPVSRKKKVVK